MDHIPQAIMLCPACWEETVAEVKFGDDRITANEDYSYEFDWSIDLSCGYHQNGVILWRGLTTPSIFERIRAAHFMMLKTFQDKNFLQLPLLEINEAEWIGPSAIHSN